MKYVWLFEYSPNEDGGDYPELYSSFKKALYRFNDEYEFVKARGVIVEVIREDRKLATSWIEGKGTAQEVQHSIRIEKLEVS